MSKLEVLNSIMECGVVAVIRGDSKDEAVLIADACIKGGIVAIEVTFTIQNAEMVIKEVASAYGNRHDVVIGAGTVLDAVTARIAILAGAQFIVSPCFDEQTARLCNLYQVPYMPGCMTVTEMKTALELGSDMIKLFPGSAFGPEFIKAVKAPLPQVNIMPTGGVSLENVNQWIKNGCAAVGVGGNLIAPAKKGEYEKISDYAREYVIKVKEAREALI